MNQYIAVVIMQCIFAASYVWATFVVTKFWAWFVLPATGIVQPAFMLLLGMIICIRFITFPGDEIPTKSADDINWSGTIFDTFFMPAMFLFWGFIAHLFV